MDEIRLCCARCGSVRIVIPAWYTDTIMWCRCEECGHLWNVKGPK